jgi:hypothetical protein
MEKQEVVIAVDNSKVNSQTGFECKARNDVRYSSTYDPLNISMVN